MPRKKGMTSEEASFKKIRGHILEYDFAELIGGQVQRGDGTEKKDVLDIKDQTHSVKGGDKKWQIFLYSRSHFDEDDIFRSLNGLSEIFVSCVDVFPKDWEKYKENRQHHKDLLKIHMTELKETLSRQQTFRTFLLQSFFKGNQVDYFSVQPPSTQDWHIFSRKDVIDVLSQNLSVENSRKRNKDQNDAQKVVFKHGTTHGEIEVRTDPTNYRRLKFWMDSKKTTSLLQDKISKSKELKDNLFVWGEAIKTFKLPRSS